MKRRYLLQATLGLPLLGCTVSRTRRSRVRPGEPAWPSAAEWERLKERVGGRLVQPVSPLGNADVLGQLDNPYFIGDDPALTQTSGWLAAWSSRRSAYAVSASGTADVVAAVNFARERDLRLVIKGGGRSYTGGSTAPDRFSSGLAP